MHPGSYTNIHYDVTDLVNHGMIKNAKTLISWERRMIFLKTKKLLTCVSDDTFSEVNFFTEGSL